MRAAFGSRTSGSRTNHEGKSITWSTPSASMSARRAWGSRQPASRPNFAFHASVPGVSAPTSRLDQPGQPTSAALDRSREAGIARPLISRTSVSVWKWNWVFTQARTSRGTYSSQIAGGSTMWLSQSKIGKALAFITSSSRSDGQQGLAGRGLDAQGVERAGDHRVVTDDGGGGAVRVAGGGLCASGAKGRARRRGLWLILSHAACGAGVAFSRSTSGTRARATAGPDFA